MSVRQKHDDHDNYSISIKLTAEEYNALEQKRATIHEQVGIWVSPTGLVRSWITDQLGIVSDGKKHKRTRSRTHAE